MDISGLSAEAVFAKHCFVSDTTMRETLSSLVLGGQPLIAGYGEARLGDFQQSLLQATFSAGYISKQAMDQLLAAALQTESGTYQAIAKSVSTPWTAKPPEYPIAFSEFKAWRDSSSAWVYKRDSKTLMKKLEHDLQEAGAEKDDIDEAELGKVLRGLSYIPGGVQTALLESLKSQPLQKAPEKKDPIAAKKESSSALPSSHYSRYAVLQQLVATSQKGGASQLSAAETDWFNSSLALSDEAERSRALTQLSIDFNSVALVFGRIIISEMFAAPEHQTLSKKDLGGVAGGDKFVIHSILFKLARDTDVTKGQAAKPYYMYAADSDGPSYEFAMKTAAHEMRYAGQLAKHLSFAGKTRVCIPMYTIVDSLGFRLLAMPLMPLKGGQQVCGSADAGRTVLSESDEMTEALGKAAAAMHLAGMTVKLRTADGKTVTKQLHSATDVEVHFGADKQYHILDLARVYPPEDPSICTHLPAQPQGVFFRLLRPELIALCDEPLCPDALTPFLGLCSPEDQNQFNLRAAAASRKLVEQVESFAAELAKQADYSYFGSVSVTEELRKWEASWSSELHRRGINVRHQGLLRSSIRDGELGMQAAGATLYRGLLSAEWAKQLPDLMLGDMAARTMKNLLRAKLRREHEARCGEVSEFRARNDVVQFLNRACSTGAAGRDFWCNEGIPGIIARFGSQALTEDEQKDATAMSKFVTHGSRLPSIVERAVSGTGLRLTQSCIGELRKMTLPTREGGEEMRSGFFFTIADVEEVGARTKSMSLLEYHHGLYLAGETGMTAKANDQKQLAPVKAVLAHPIKPVPEEAVPKTLRLLSLAADALRASYLGDGLSFAALREAKFAQHNLAKAIVAADEALITALRAVDNRVEGDDQEALLECAVPLLLTAVTAWRARLAGSSGVLYHCSRGAATWELLSEASMLSYTALRHMKDDKPEHKHVREELAYAVDGSRDFEKHSKAAVKFINDAFGTVSQETQKQIEAPERDPFISAIQGWGLTTRRTVLKPSRGELLFRMLVFGAGKSLDWFSMVYQAHPYVDYSLALAWVISGAVTAKEPLRPFSPDEKQVAAPGIDTVNFGVHGEWVDQVVAACLLAGADARTRFRDREMLEYAAYGGRVASVKLLVAAGATMSAVHGALVTAVTRGSIEMTQVLLASGATELEAPMNVALSSKHDVILSLLLDANAQPQGGHLHSAAASGFAKGLDLMLAALNRGGDAKAPAEQEQEDQEARLPHMPLSQSELIEAFLHDALHLCETASAVKLLVDRKADPTLGYADMGGGGANDRLPVLHSEHTVRNVECICALVAAKADLEAPNGGEQTPLSAAATNSKPGSDLNGVKNLLEAKANPRPTPQGVLIYLRTAPVEVARLLVESKADIHEKTTQGITPLLSAAQVGRGDMVKFLLEHKANAADRDKYERTALMLNAENEENAQQDGSLCKMLVDAGCPINAQDTMGKTALMHGANVTNPNTVKHLLALKADVSLRCKDGKTALAYAKNEHTIAALKAAGAVPHTGKH